jgi:hypothetical protein
MVYQENIESLICLKQGENIESLIVANNMFFQASLMNRFRRFILPGGCEKYLFSET